MRKLNILNIIVKKEENIIIKTLKTIKIKKSKYLNIKNYLKCKLNIASH